jgi:hypothetical protein
MICARLVVAIALGIAPLGACASFTSPNDASDAGPADSSTTPDAASDSNGAGSNPYRQAILDDGPLVYWRMDLAAGLTIPDETGGNNDLTLKGGGHVLGVAGASARLGSAIVFDGVSAFAEAKNPRAFDFAGKQSFTIEAWVRRDASETGDYFQQIVGASEGSPPASNGFALYIVERTDGSATVGTHFEHYASGLGEIGVRGKLARADGWSHVVAVYDASAGANGAITIYVDDAGSAATSVFGVIAPRLSAFSVGSASGGATNFFAGAIDEFAVYAKALDANTVSRHRAIALGQ